MNQCVKCGKFRKWEDHGKRSKKGLLDLVFRANKYETVQGMDGFGSLLKVVYENGQIVKETNLTKIRETVNMFLK